MFRRGRNSRISCSTSEEKPPHHDLIQDGEEKVIQIGEGVLKMRGGKKESE